MPSELDGEDGEEGREGAADGDLGEERAHHRRARAGGGAARGAPATIGGPPGARRAAGGRHRRRGRAGRRTATTTQTAAGERGHGRRARSGRRRCPATSGPAKVPRLSPSAVTTFADTSSSGRRGDRRQERHHRRPDERAGGGRRRRRAAKTSDRRPRATMAAAMAPPAAARTRLDADQGPLRRGRGGPCRRATLTSVGRAPSGSSATRPTSAGAAGLVRDEQRHDEQRPVHADAQRPRDLEVADVAVAQRRPRARRTARRRATGTRSAAMDPPETRAVGRAGARGRQEPRQGRRHWATPAGQRPSAPAVCADPGLDDLAQRRPGRSRRSRAPCRGRRGCRSAAPSRSRASARRRRSSSCPVL